MEDDEDPKPAEAKDYYTRPLCWSENEHAVDGIHFAGSKHNLDYNSKEILTPEISMENNLVLNDMSEVGDEGNFELEHYSRQALSSEISEIVEDGKSITVNQDRRAQDIYVAVGKDDLDVVKWVLDHAVSPSSRIFLIHVSPPIILIPTPVGNLPRSQLNQQQVRIYVNEEMNERKNILQKYIQLGNDAQVTAETLLLESNDTAKAILDLIPILNIKNLVFGIKKPPHSWGKIKLSIGEFVKTNAPEFCEVVLVYDGNQVLNSHYKDSLVSFGVVSRKDHLKGSFLCCTCFSGKST